MTTATWQTYVGFSCVNQVLHGNIRRFFPYKSGSTYKPMENVRKHAN